MLILLYWYFVSNTYYIIVVCHFVGPTGRQVHTSVIGSAETGFDVDFTPVEVGTYRLSLFMFFDNI